MIPSLWSRPVLALIVVLMLCGHDVLMAADPHRLDDAPHASHAAGAATLETQCHEPEGTRTVSPDWPPGNTFDAMALTDAALVLPREIAPVASGPPPGYPPGVRRALLQVYLN